MWTGRKALPGRVRIQLPLATMGRASSEVTFMKPFPDVKLVKEAIHQNQAS
jgi:hypothetical protein